MIYSESVTTRLIMWRPPDGSWLDKGSQFCLLPERKRLASLVLCYSFLSTPNALIVQLVPSTHLRWIMIVIDSFCNASVHFLGIWEVVKAKGKNVETTTSVVSGHFWRRKSNNVRSW